MAVKKEQTKKVPSPPKFEYHLIDWEEKTLDTFANIKSIFEAIEMYSEQDSNPLQRFSIIKGEEVLFKVKMTASLLEENDND